MKKVKHPLLKKIDLHIEQTTDLLDARDAESHIWYAKFREILRKFDPEEHWKITFYNRETNRRETYLNNTAFSSKAEADAEINRIKKQQAKRSPRSQKRVYFKSEKIKMLKNGNNNIE